MKASEDLWKAIARVARRIRSSCSYVGPKGLTSFTACHLITLDKNPGVKPIGVGEVLRRLIGKAILKVMSAYIHEAVGVQQLCTGQVSGAEAGVHVMRKIKKTQHLMVDAGNAFNTLNCEAALRNLVPNYLDQYIHIDMIHPYLLSEVSFFHEKELPG